MENKLDVLTKKLYEEGIAKANEEAEKILVKAQSEAARIVAEAEAEAGDIRQRAQMEAENMKKKAEAEMTLSARQALTALKQAVSGLIAGEVASEIAGSAFREENFVHELMLEIVKKWDIASGSLNLEVVLPEDEREKFHHFVATRCKELLDKGLEVKAGVGNEAFVIRPKDGGYQVAFSEELFEAFFNRYIRSFTKELLYKS